MTADITRPAEAEADLAPAVIEFERVRKVYRGGRLALDDVSIKLQGGRSLGLVGESGSGKTTCVRLALGLERPTSGRLAFNGAPYPSGRRGLRPLRRQIGFVLQDPYDSLDPKMTIRDIVAEPLRIHGLATGSGAALDHLVAAQLAAAGLPGADLRSYPSRYSGGGRQRIAIARALIAAPTVLICDEPTSSLDVSVQSQIVNLLLEARAQRDLSMLFVSHDLDLIGRVTDTVAVMYGGQVVEIGPADQVRRSPRHHYTKALHDAVPADHPSRRRLSSPVLASSGLASSGLAQYEVTSSEAAGEAASIGREPGEQDGRAASGGGLIGRTRVETAQRCVFAGRCPAATDRCRSERPAMTHETPDRSYACFYPLSDGATMD